MSRPRVRKSRPPAGSLVVVGTGIRAARHTTLEAREEMRAAQKLFYLTTDPVSERWIRSTNASAESLAGCYRTGESRAIAYERMVDKILRAVRSGRNVCGAFYGHPGVFVLPSHEAIRRSRAEGWPARMVPGISAEDCLFADLGIDPARSGCQSFEATDLLVHRRRFDPSSALLIWQAGLVGRSEFRRRFSKTALAALGRRLGRAYGARHPVVLYEASAFSAFEPIVRTTTIAELSSAALNGRTTLFLPPKPRNPDPAVLHELRISTRDAARAGPCWQSGA